MKLAPNPTYASRTAQGGWLARALRTGAAALVVAVVASSPALAQRHGGDRNDQRQDQRTQDQRMPDQRQDPRTLPQRAPEQAQPRFEPRAFDSREFDERRQEAAQRDPHRAMTPDERRDLRRQINEAGMDLYTRPPRH
jgi:hypothetical protein